MNVLASIFGLLTRFQRPAAASAPPLATVLAHETQSFPETLARIAESQVGKQEQGGNNLGPDVVEYQKATNLPPGSWPWCAAFVCWCVWLAIRTLGLSPLWKRPTTALAYGLEDWATRTAGAWCVITSVANRPDTWPRRGDIVTFTWSHTGIVTGYDPQTKKLQTSEGNAGLKKTRDTPSGDGVVAKDQHIANVRRLIRYVG